MPALCAHSQGIQADNREGGRIRRFRRRMKPHLRAPFRSTDVSLLLRRE